MLPRVLRALSAQRIIGSDDDRLGPVTEEKIDLGARPDASEIDYDAFHAIILDPVPMAHALRALKWTCFVHKARLKTLDVREQNLNEAPRAIVAIKRPGKLPRKAVLFMDGDFVSLVPLP